MLAFLVVKANKAHDDDLMDLVTFTNKQTKQTNKWIMWDLVASTNKQNDYVHLVVVSTNKMMIICIPGANKGARWHGHHRPNLSLGYLPLFNHCTLLLFQAIGFCRPCLTTKATI